MKYIPLLFVCLATSMSARAATFVVEAEQFSEKGGWQVDTQFIESMGSPYLIAHGMGTAVADAMTSVSVPEAGNYRVWVRTIDWTRRLGRPASAGRFRLAIDGEVLGGELGAERAEWHWQLVAERPLKAGEAKVSLRDLTGFNGRVDAVLFSSDPSFTPPAANDIHERQKWGFPGASAAVEDMEKFDLVVVGGGYGGLGTAISAARFGLKVALVQNRMVLGGNGSSEIRVWAMGQMPPSEYPLADIVREIQDEAKASPAPAEQFVDDKKDQVVRAEKNITLFLGHHAYGLDMDGKKIAAAKVLEVSTGKLRRIPGKFFADCTGHGFIGQWSGADLVMQDKGRMGMSNMWMWENTGEAQAFPDEAWMLKLTTESFPYPRKNHAEWFWESGFDKHPIKELEITRDWNLVASYSAWSAIKNHGAHKERDPDGHAKAKLSWMAYVGGTRETQQLLGDVILKGTDVESKTPFDDGLVLTTWSIDLHYPQKQYANVLPEHPFIAEAVHRHAVEKRIGYPIPYRSFYSRNVPNLFMAGRNISVDRDALGTIRVMKTIGMMGVVVGRAAAICVVEDCGPRDVYQTRLETAKQLWRLPGNHRFSHQDELRTFIRSKPPTN